jgi:Tfp pilus assembly protein PilX
MTAHRQTPGQIGAITLLVAIGLVILASLTSFYSARSALMDQLASQNHAHASQARLAADAALASAQAALPSTASPISALLATRAPCPAGVSGPQWQCSALAIAPHPAMAQTQLSAVAVRDLVVSPHVLALHASASSSANNSKAHARESLFVPTVAPAPDLPAPAALVLNGCVSEAAGASLRVCPLVSEGGSCTASAKGPAVQTHFVLDTNGNGSISSAEKNACLALKTTSLPGGGSKTGPSTAVARSPCNRAAWRSVLGDITDEQLQAWSAAQEANGLTAQTKPPRSVYWIDSPADWQLSVGTAATPAVLLFSAKACAQRCPRIATSVRIVGSVLLDSGCNDEKMRGWQGGTIEGQLVVESGLPEWRLGTVLARPEGRDAYILNWPEGIDARQVQRINGSWSEGKP